MVLKNKFLINMGPLKKGGGQNVGLNFIYSLSDFDWPNLDLYFVVASGSKIHDVLSSSDFSNNLIVVSSNPFVRLIDEMTKVRSFIKKNNIDLTYTYFGFALIGSNNKQVIGSADSNLYFPEINFWQGEGFFKRILRFCIDRYRIYGLKNSYAVVYENPEMYVRASQLFGIQNKTLILPSINFSIGDLSFDFKLSNNRVKILLLCGWQRNKNILLIPALAHQLNLIMKFDCEFVISVDLDNSSVCKEFMHKVSNYCVSDFIRLIGPVNKEKIPSLYNQIDCVLLLSKLESFSNNIIESWFYKKPLIVSNESWAKSICSDAAIYVNRDDVVNIADCICLLAQNNDLVKELVINGLAKLGEYPSIAQRTSQELEYLIEINKNV